MSFVALIEPGVLALTSRYAGALTLFYMVLVMAVIMRRATAGVSLGGGSDALLETRIRAHGNFAENAPFCLLLMALLELGGTVPSWVLHALGVTLVVGRLLHAYAFWGTTPVMAGRIAGVALMFVFYGYAGALLLFGGGYVALIVGSVAGVLVTFVRFKIIKVGCLTGPPKPDLAAANATSYSS